MNLIRLSILILLFVACDPLSTYAVPVTARIFGGGVSQSTDTVALLVEGQKGAKGIFICSGTFISATKYLTAKHCVAKNGFKSPKFLILTSPRGPAIQVKNIVKSSRVDLAIITIDAASVVPSPIMLSRAISIGDQIQFYGYGQDQAQKTAVERSERNFLKYGSGNIGDTDSSYYYFRNSSAGGACHGDSGGPMVALNSNGEAGIIGVANAVKSRTRSQKCAAGNIARYTRITDGPGLSFIATYAPEALVN